MFSVFFCVPSELHSFTGCTERRKLLIAFGCFAFIYSLALFLIYLGKGFF